MKLYPPKNQNRDISRRVARTTILGTYVTVLGTILGIMFTWSQLRIANSAEDRAQRAEPLSYTLEAVNTHYQYDIQADDITASFPAPSFRLQVTMEASIPLPRFPLMEMNSISCPASRYRTAGSIVPWISRCPHSL